MKSDIVSSLSNPALSQQKKKAYQAPKITIHGSVAKLTRGQGSLDSDGASGGKKKK